MLVQIQSQVCLQLNHLHHVVLMNTVGFGGVSIGFESSKDPVGVSDIESSDNSVDVVDSPSELVDSPSSMNLDN